MPFMHFSPNPREGREGPVAALTEDARPWGNSSSRGKGVARRILSNETLEGGSMIPFLEASEAYWKVRVVNKGGSGVMMPFAAALCQLPEVSPLHHLIQSPVFRPSGSPEPEA